MKFSQIFPCLCLCKVDEKYTALLVREESGCVSAPKSKRESISQEQTFHNSATSCLFPTKRIFINTPKKACQ